MNLIQTQGEFAADETALEIIKHTSKAEMQATTEVKDPKKQVYSSRKQNKHKQSYTEHNEELKDPSIDQMLDGQINDGFSSSRHQQFMEDTLLKQVEIAKNELKLQN